MATGVGVHDDVVTQFEDFKLQRAPYNFRFYVYKIEGDEIIIDRTAAREATYEDFCSVFVEENETEPRYGLFDLEYETSDGRPSSKLILVSWTPESSKVRDKMVYAGSLAALKRVLNGVSVHVEANDPTDLDYEYLLQQATRFG